MRNINFVWAKEGISETKILVITFWNFALFLVQTRFAINKTKLGIWYNKLGIRFAARVAE